MYTLLLFLCPPTTPGFLEVSVAQVRSRVLLNIAVDTLHCWVLLQWSQLFANIPASHCAVICHTVEAQDWIRYLLAWKDKQRGCELGRQPRVHQGRHPPFGPSFQFCHYTDPPLFLKKKFISPRMPLAAGGNGGERLKWAMKMLLKTLLGFYLLNQERSKGAIDASQVHISCISWRGLHAPAGLSHCPRLPFCRRSRPIKHIKVQPRPK